MATERSVRFLDMDVLEAAKQRVRYILANYDHVVCAFSGGKDSLAVIHLVRLVLDEDGKKDVPVKCVFMDEEIIPDPVINFVQTYIDKPGFDLTYYAVPMKSHIFLMGQHRPYVQWDETREWMRPKPPCARTKLHPTNVAIDQHDTNGLMAADLGLKGKICVLTGIRAGESLTRYRSVMVVGGERCYISTGASGVKNIHGGKPIYDWNEPDLFKFFKEQKVDYAAIYNMQMWASHPLRVATPLHDKAYQSLVKLREMYPLFYQQIIHIWPEVATHELYWKDVDRLGIINRYPKSWEGIVQYIEENVSNPTNKAVALKVLARTKTAKERNRRLGRFADTHCYGFSLLRVFRSIVAGSYMKGIQVSPEAKGIEIEYELAAEAEAQGAPVRTFDFN